MASPVEDSLQAEPLLLPEVVLGQWCRTLFSGLIAAGVREVVVSPGSRSTPLVMQALKESQLTCHAVLDERSAGFFALGLASVGGPPPLLICTSGTAVAHYLPAVIEARMSALPLLVLSADRPAELQDCGAAQTISQLQLLSPYALAGPPLGTVSSDSDALRSLLRKSVQAVALSQGPLPGPVHLNFPVAKPLEIETPAAGDTVQAKAGRALAERVSRMLERAPLVPPVALVTPALSELKQLAGELLENRKRTCVTLGPASEQVTHLALRFAELIGAPLLAELSPVRRARTPLDALFSHWANWARQSDSGKAEPRTIGGIAPERVIHLGLPCVSAHWLRFFETSEVELWSVPGPEWKDPSNRAERMILGDLAATLELLNSQLECALPENSAVESSFPELNDQLAACRDTRRTAAAALQQAELARAGSATPELLACQTLLDSIPARCNVLLGNSLSVRLAGWSELDDSPTCRFFVQRGVNGIDGQISRSAGIAHAAQGPTLAVLGDVTAAHDLGGLLVARHCQVPLVIAVIDNDGGRLFDHLPVGKKLENQKEYEFWTTPPRIEWQSAAATYGVQFRCCTTQAQIRAAMNACWSGSGVTLLHIPADSQSTRLFLSQTRAQS